MEDVLRELERSRNGCSDIFSFWEKELRLRQELRQYHPTGPLPQPKDARDMYFLFRSLYFSGNKGQFYTILLENLDNAEVLNWLLSSSPSVITDFLSQLPWRLQRLQTYPERLRFLIAIYQDEYQQYFQRIISLLGETACDYLLPRTANPALRDLFKSRREQIRAQSLANRYQVEIPAGGYDNPTLFGDRMTLLADCSMWLEQCSPSNFPEPFGLERFLHLLQSCEKLFQAGLISDSLLLAMETYQDYQQRNRLNILLEDEAVHKAFSKLLRALIPLYSLLEDTRGAAGLSHRIYTDYFEMLSPDAASLEYLKLNTAITTSSCQEEGKRLFTLYPYCERIKLYRPTEPPLLEKGTGENPFKLNPSFLLELGREKTGSLPHEVIITLNLLRYIYTGGSMDLSRQHADEMMTSYLCYWSWVPSPHFFNIIILQELGSLLSPGVRSEAEKVLRLINIYSEKGLENDLATRPDLFCKNDETNRRILASGKFLGVV